MFTPSLNRYVYSYLGYPDKHLDLFRRHKVPSHSER
jgi:hypothetical protein